MRLSAARFNAGIWGGVAADRRQQGDREHPRRDQAGRRLYCGRSSGKEDSVALASRRGVVPRNVLKQGGGATAVCFVFVLTERRLHHQQRKI